MEESGRDEPRIAAAEANAGNGGGGFSPKGRAIEDVDREKDADIDDDMEDVVEDVVDRVTVLADSIEAAEAAAVLEAAKGRDRSDKKVGTDGWCLGMGAMEGGGWSKWLTLDAFVSSGGKDWTSADEEVSEELSEVLTGFGSKEL